MNKLVKRIIVALYCIYIVCSFLPTKFVFSNGTQILGSEVLFPILNGTEFAPLWQVPMIFLAMIFIGLFATLFFAKRKTTIYINTVINMILSIIYIFGMILGTASGKGVEICLVISALILIINIFALVVFGSKNSKKTAKTNSDIKTTNRKETVSSSAAAGSNYCKKCGRFLFANETCSCTSSKKGTVNPVKISKCPRCGRTLFGNEICTCGK